MMHRKDISIVVDNNLCTGCGTCKVVCPVKAIQLKKTNIGRLYACIDKEICLSCQVCYQICPGIDIEDKILSEDIDPFKGTIINTYTGISADKTIYENSQSGGLVTETLAFLFDFGYIDAAIVCTSVLGLDKPQIIYSIINDKIGLLKSQRSVYTPIDMVSALDHIHNYKSVAFVGLPCHIHGVFTLQEKYKRYQNISFKLGLICDRTLSETIVDVLLSSENVCLEKKINWRDKRGYSYKTAPITIEYGDGSYKTLPSIKRHLLKNVFTSPRCRICFDKMNIHSDILYGDPWKMENINWEKGESLVISRTKRGDDVIQNMIRKNRVIMNKALFEEVVIGQGLDAKKRQMAINTQVYMKKRWLLPSYLTKQEFVGINNREIFRNERVIDAYLNLEKKSKDKITKKINHILKLLIFKHKIKTIFFFLIRS